MVEAMLRGWRAQQVARGLREDTVVPRERLVRRFLEFTSEYPWAWSPGHMDEWSLSLTAEQHLAPSTIRSYQCTLRQFSEFLIDGRYGWAVACEQAFGPGQHPVAIAMSGTRSLTSTTTRATRRPGRSPARSCSGSWITPMSRWTGRCGPGARARWLPTGTRRCSR